jgi:hypothetical protein
VTGWLNVPDEQEPLTLRSPRSISTPYYTVQGSNARLPSSVTHHTA